MFQENVIIDAVAALERSIVGVTNSYGSGQNPDAITNAMLPCCIHYVPSATAAPRAFHGVWANTVNLKSVLFVTQRQASGGKLKFLEGTAIPYTQLWRAKFQDPTVIQNLLSTTAAIKCWWSGGQYGAGPPYLDFSGVSFLGYVMSFLFVSA